MNDPHAVILRESFKDNPLLARLFELHDVPQQIYIEGVLPECTLDEYGRLTPRILTIVGSRKNTTYGRQVVEALLSQLQGYNIVILSGLALGIDGLAHHNALKNKLHTIAIPGSGLSPNVLYPSTHKNLAKDIVAKGGALISELPHDTPAAPWTFPKRNRIMAALSDALLVIEAEEKSGTLITARLALELGRDIGAIPGEIFSQNTTGTNMLIHEGAYAITSISDLLSLLHISEERDTTPKREYSLHEKTIIDLLREPKSTEELFAKTNLPFEDYIAAFSSLEIDGQIEETFGEVRRIV